ncbi:MAG TPA: HK97-gp10 family putative phage morphogenesis protein [Sphingomicrobium sp.]|jgi:HK97 gp10 family phage protein|nr:HK97-gp10 family putative phage morphogenesis protein [Sphingomicrobium sp.]
MAERIEGLAECERVLFELSRATAKGTVRRVLKKAAEPMRALAASLAPDDPATPPLDLHTSIAISHRQKGGRQRSFTREARDEVAIYIGPTRKGYPQAIMMEFGTFKDRAQPYMRPAWEREQGPSLVRIANLLGEELHKTVMRIRRRQGG